MYEVIVPRRFWLTANKLKTKYSHEQFVEIILIIKEAIDELSEKGYVDVVGWNDHLLQYPPFADGCHFAFHIYDDDVLVVYFKRESKNRIRMVGIYDHGSLPRA